MHASPVWSDGVELHQTGVQRPGGALPDHLLVGDLFADLRIPLVFMPGNLGAPVQVTVVDLADLAHALHEAWERLELRPLVVCRTYRHCNFNVLLDPGHPEPPSNADDRDTCVKPTERGV